MITNSLTGIRVKLRAPEPGDIDLLYAWENDMSIWNVSNTLTPFSRFHIEEYVLNSQKDIFTVRQLRLMIDLKVLGTLEEPVGTIDLFDFEPLHQRAGVGIFICEPFRKKGYAFEALNIFIRYVFDNLRLHQLFCNISPDNAASLRLFTSLGFTKCGIKKEWVKDDQKWQDEWMYQLIHHDD
jgi:diamine N-acetyltransferase